ncbi:MAG: beta-galactosidase [Bowdeniella nasicola]|nr:beta-galactosidase [Bowdeniella nasicola]
MTRPHSILSTSTPGGVPVLHYGADYNPEQWPDEILAEDIALMREAGVTMVSVAIFAWAELEPRDGEFTFERLDTVIEALHEAGIAVDLATATASPPAWLGLAYPETLPVTREGVRLGHGSRQHICPSSPVFRRYSARLASRLAERYGTHPAVRLWHVSNEYGNHVARCYCETSAAAFRDWLRERYATIEELNEAWGTAFWSQRYDSFDEVGVPAATPSFPNPGQEADFSRFSSDELLACYLAEKEAIREHSNVPITTNFMADFPPVNYREWARHVDVVTDDSYPEPVSQLAAREAAYVSDLMRSLGDGRPFYLMEQTTSAVQWRERNSRKRPGVFTLQSLQRVAHGADAIMQFQWRQSVRGAETFHSAMVSHSGRESTIWPEVVGLGHDLAALSDVVGSRVHADVALLMDWDSRFHRASAIGPGPDRGDAALRAWHGTAFERGYPVDVVFPDSDLRGYRVIIVPELFALSADLAAALTDAAHAGTQVIVTAPTGVLDDTGRAIEGGYASMLSDLLGIRVLEHRLPAGARPREVDPRVDTISAHIHPAGATDEVGIEVVPGSALDRTLERIAHPKPAPRGSLWAEELALEDDVEVLATFSDDDLAGWPALTYRPCGAGGGTYAATDLDAAGRAALLRLAEARARLCPPELPGGVESVRRGEFTFLLNHGERAAELSGQVGLNVLTGTRVTGHLVLPPRSAAVLREEEDA